METLHRIYQKQDKVICNIESGAYTYSQKGVRIPETEKPEPVTKETFPILFSMLENGGGFHSRVGSVSSPGFSKQSVGAVRPGTRGNI